MVKLIDFAYDVPATFQEGKGLVGGFTMRTINTTRLCWTTVSQACLKVKGPDVRLWGEGVGGWVVRAWEGQGGGGVRTWEGQGEGVGGAGRGASV
jgi:hypothetical protein